MKNLKLGDKVKIKDGSYMNTIVNGEFTHTTKDIPIIGHNMDVWEVIMCNIDIKGDESITYKNPRNNTAIVNTRNKEVWFCNTKFNIYQYEIKEYTMDELKSIVGHEFKIV